MTLFQKMMMKLLLGFKPPLSDTVGTSQEFRVFSMSVLTVL